MPDLTFQFPNPINEVHALDKGFKTFSPLKVISDAL